MLARKYSSVRTVAILSVALLLALYGCSERAVEPSDEIGVEFEIAHPLGSPASPELLNLYLSQF